MAINVADNFSYKGGKPLDARTKYTAVADMVATPAADLYDGCLAYVTATKKNYQYDSSNTSDPTLGKWRELQTGGGGGTDYTAGDGIDITNDVISTKQSQQGDIDEIVDVYPQAGNLVSIVNAFNKGDLYSTEEKMIGQWIDGKPLYARTYETTVTSSEKGTWKSIGSVPSDISIKKYNPLLNANDGSFQMKDDGYVGTNYLTQEMYQSAIVRIENNVLKLYVNTAPESVNLFPYTYNITLYYTKTTDTAISIGEETEYSTDEKVVGTWIDGKPLYQRTFNYGAMQSGINSINLGANIGVLLNVEAFAYAASNGGFWCVPYVSNGNLASQIEVWSGKTDGNQLLKFRSGTDYSYANFYFTVRYTKTTT